MGICERPPGRSPRGDEETASGARVFGERIFEKLRQRTEIGKNDEGVIGRLAVGGLIDADRFEDEGRLRGGGERGPTYSGEWLSP